MSIDDTVLLEKSLRTDREIKSHKSPTQPEEKWQTRTNLCKFCDSAINDTVRTLFSRPTCCKSFCKDAEHLHGLWKTWEPLKSEPITGEPVTNQNKSHFRSSKSSYLTKAASNDIKNIHNSQSDVNLRKRNDHKYGDTYSDKCYPGCKNGNNNEYHRRIKSRIGVPKKRGTCNLNEFGEDVKVEKKGYEGKGDNSREKMDGSKGQERPSKMIHDRLNKKIRPSKEIPPGWLRVKPIRRRSTFEEARQPDGKEKKRDAPDKLNDEEYRLVDEEKKFRKNPEKRKEEKEGNGGKVETRNPPSGKKYRTGTEKSTLNLELGSSTGGNGTMPTKSKGSKFAESSLTTGEDFTRTSSSRNRNIKSNATRCQNEIGPPNTIEYQLSNEHFANLGWTVLPVRKIMRKMFVYEARMAKPHLNWFKRYRHEGRKYYEDGLTPFLTFHPDATGEVFYPNGRIAIKVNRPKNREYDMYTVFTPGGKDVLGVVRESQIIAAFDTLGNGIILDENGSTRLSYNQIGGIWRDNPRGLPFHWTWSSNVQESIIESIYSEKSTSELDKLLPSPGKKKLGSTGTMKTASASVAASTRERTVISGGMEQKSLVDAVVVVGDHEKDLESEFHAIREDRSSIERDSNIVKIICLRLNEYLSFRILNRRNVSLQFFAGTKSIRIELGTVLNYNKKLSSYHSDMVNWKSDAHRCRFENCGTRKLEPDNSLCDLAREFQRVRRYMKHREAIIGKYRPFFK